RKAQTCERHISIRYSRLRSQIKLARREPSSCRCKGERYQAVDAEEPCGLASGLQSRSTETSRRRSQVPAAGPVVGLLAWATELAITACMMLWNRIPSG